MHRFFGFFKRRNDDMNFIVKKLGHSFIKRKKKNSFSIFIIIFLLYYIIYIEAYKIDIYYLIYLKLID